MKFINPVLSWGRSWSGSSWWPIGMSFGMMHGYAINPARDLGPRLFSVLAGFKNNGLTDGSGVWLVPIIGPLVGAPVGALLYGQVMGRIISK